VIRRLFDLSDVTQCDSESGVSESRVSESEPALISGCYCQLLH